MVLAYLGRHWRARRHYPLPSWLACIARSLRVLLFYGAHRRLLALGVYRDHVCRAHDDVFHHLSHRHYLATDLSLRQRVRCVLNHYRFEDVAFDAAYKQAVYGGGGLLLWQQEAGGHRFTLKLQMAERLNAEGDLTIAAAMDGVVLHRLSFSWVDAQFAGIDLPALPSAMASVLPFVARNQGRKLDAAEAFAAFEQAFPHNSPSFFCFAALQGIALALGMDQAVAVKASRHGAHAGAGLDKRHFTNAYDGFWQVLGGVSMPGRAYRIALPFYLKPLSEMPSRHRKRAAMRRAYWRAIAESAGSAVERRLAHRHSRRNEAREPATQ